MITDHEIIDFTGNINAVLGIDKFESGEEKSFDMGNNRIIKWHVLDLLEHKLKIDNFAQTEVGNVFGSQAGEALHVIIDNSEFLYIDLGSAQDSGRSARHRKYSVFPLK